MKNNELYFPAVIVNKVKDGFQAAIGMELLSILGANVYDFSLWDFGDHDRNSRKKWFDPAQFHHSYSALLRSLAAWPSGITIELHLAGSPDLAHIVRGKIEITIVLHANGKTRDDCMGEVLNRYTILQGSLNAYITEAEFSPIRNQQILEKRLSPFKPEHALCIRRRREKLSLATPLQGKRVGFLDHDSKFKNDFNPKDYYIDHLFPWNPPEDDMRRMIETLLWHPSPLWMVVRLRKMDNPMKEISRLEDTLHTCEAFLSGQRNVETILSYQARALRDATFKRIAKLKEASFNLGVFLFSKHRVDEGIARTMGQTITSGADGKKTGELLEGGFTLKKVSAKRAVNSNFFTQNIPYTPAEAACAFRLPWPPGGNLPGLPIKRSRTAFADLPDELIKNPGVVKLGNNIHRGVVQSIPLATDNRMQHMFVIGMTGTGKSTVLEHLILQDIRAGRGVCLIDPHGELIDEILGKFPEKRANDLILIDLLDREYPIPMNFLKWRTIEERDFIIDEFYMAIRDIYRHAPEGFGPIFEQNFRGMMKLLMGDKPRKEFSSTLLEFHLLYLNKKFRELCLKGIEDNQIQDFITEFERAGGEYKVENLAPYITSKFSRFIHDSTLKRIVGQNDMAVNFEEIMDTGKIVLINLGKGRFGEAVSGLIANLIVSRFKAATMARAAKPPHKRRDFFLYVDEFQNLVQESFNELLSEARKYRMGLVLVNQYADQLEKDSRESKNSALSAILGNVGTILSFRLGVKDAERLESVFTPVFKRHDLIELPDREGYVQLHHNSHNIQPFNIHTVKETTPYDQKLAEKLRNLSRKKYGRAAKKVDEEINARRTKIEELLKQESK